MTSNSASERFGRIPVPAQVTILTAVLTMGVFIYAVQPLTGRIPAIAPFLFLVLIWVQAVLLAFPYSLVASTASLVLFREGFGTYLPPGSNRPNGGDSDWMISSTHVAFGLFYMFIAASAGGVFVGAAAFTSVVDLTLTDSPDTLLPGAGVAAVGGLVVGAAYGVLQLRQFEESVSGRTKLGTILLAVLIAAAPAFAWVTLVLI